MCNLTLALLLNSLLFLRQGLQQDATLDEGVGYSVKHTVHIASALRSAVEFCQLHKLIDGHAYRYVGERHHLGNGNLHYHHVHESQAAEIPVPRSLVHVALELVGLEN